MGRKLKTYQTSLSFDRAIAAPRVKSERRDSNLSHQGGATEGYIEIMAKLGAFL
jgi:hypothetical protein